jgi:thiamine pyrophosphokinase
MEAERSVVIIANGLFPSARQGLDLLNSAELLICCDGAADKLIAYGKSPDVIIGDMDSVSEKVQRQFASIMVPSPDQESNDLTKAVNYCIDKAISSVSILGATGLREDHTLGNVSLMLDYFPHIMVDIVSDFGVFFLVQTGQQVKTYPGEKISIFSLDNQTKVSSAGLKYPLKDLQLSSWYKATLNEATEHSFTLEYESRQPLIVYRAW